MKIAQSVDGRAATVTGDSKWITDEHARKEVHKLRACYDAVLVGSETVRVDDPELSVRLCRDRDPLRVVLSSRLNIDFSSKLLSIKNASKLIVFRCEDRDLEILAREKAMLEWGAWVFQVPKTADGSLDLKHVLNKLFSLSVHSVLVEGGSRVFTSFVKAGFFQKISIFTAPLLIGEGRSSIGDLGISLLSEAQRLRRVSYARIGDQLLICGYKEYLHVHRAY